MKKISAVLCACILLSGMTAYAVDSISVMPDITAVIPDASVGVAKLIDNTITSAKLLDNTIATGKILDNTILTGKIADGTITGSDLASNIAISTSGAIATTGNLSGKVVILDNVSGPTAAQMYGSLNVVNEAITVLLPTAVAGMSGCVIDSGSAHDIIIDIQGTDTIALLGAADTAGEGITNASGSSAGDFACVVATATNTWRVMSRQGTWAQQ